MDFHAFFIALARSIGIPARFAIGVAIPSERDGGGTDGYHCWAEFYADGQWWPVDISEANKFSALSMYYFGHHPANRFEFSRGRDLLLDPGPAAGPINFLAYPYLEQDGRQVRTYRSFFSSVEALAEPLIAKRLGTASPSKRWNRGGFRDGGRTCGEPHKGFARASVESAKGSAK